MPEPTPPADKPATETPPPTGTPPAEPTAPEAGKDGAFDAKVLEHPDLWKQPRIAELLESKKELAKLKADQEKAAEQTLTEQKKFEDLATQRADKITQLETQLKDATINQALSGALIKDSVIDLDAALKLVDRSKLSVDDSGQVTGVEEALAALKTDRAFLFNAGTTPPTKLGAPTGDGGKPGGEPMKFKASQFQGPEGHRFYQEHRQEILEAQKKGLIENDLA